MKRVTNTFRPGVVLILALLLMAAITASTIAVSVVINSTTTQSRNLDDFIIASLAADSGMERSLAFVSLARKSQTLATTISNLSTTVPPQTNGAIFSVAAASTSGPLTVPKLSAGQSFSFDIIDTDGPCTGTQAPSSLTITGDAASTGQMQLSWVVIAYDGTSTYTGRRTLTNAEYNPGTATDLKLVSTEQSNTATSPTLDNGSCHPLGYRVSVTGTTGSITNISIASPTTLPSRISVTSTGQSGSTRSIKNATVLWQLPSSRLFNFVLFTEGEIVPSS